jgi:molybdate transport system ATP-binding protein
MGGVSQIVRLAGARRIIGIVINSIGGRRLSGNLPEVAAESRMPGPAVVRWRRSGAVEAQALRELRHALHMSARGNRPVARPDRHLTVELVRVDLIRGRQRVLRDIRWRIRPGQRWVLQGANGAGKTQLLKLVAGAVWPQPRRKSRRSYTWRGERHDQPMGIQEEIAYLGAERQDRYEHYGWNHRVNTIVGTGLQRSDVPLRALSAGERTRVARLLRRLRIEPLARRRFLLLSQGERRLVLLARALAWRPALLLLDEPLNGLDAGYRTRVLRAIGRLRRSALPWVYATHRPEEVPAGATHWARLRGGRLRTGRWPPRRRHGAPARAAQPALRAARPGPGPARRAGHAALIELRRASVWRAGTAVLREVSVQLHRGECWVVHGANGSGKSTLLGALNGDHGIAAAGTIRRLGHPEGTPLGDFQRQVGVVSPELQAALPRHLTALEAVVAGLRGAFGLDGLPRARERRLARGALGPAGATGPASFRMGDLSYGQARRVLFARALARRPAIVLLDEPYTGLDAPTRARLRGLVRALAGEGKTVVIATHHRDDWPACTTHELELAGGRVAYCGPVRPAFLGRGARAR